MLNATHSLPLRIFAAVLALIGIFLLAAGGWLVVLGGSLYYALAGLALLASAALLWRGNHWGASVYEATALATILWAMWEVGFDLWALAPRITAPLLLMGFLFTPWIRRGLHGAEGHDGEDGAKEGDGDGDGDARLWKGTTAAIAVAILGVAAVFLVPQLGAQEPRGAASITAHGGDDGRQGDWRHYANTAFGSHYSALDQINEYTIDRLELAWEYRTGDLPRSTDGADAFTFQATPIEIDDTLYLCTPHGDVIALNAETGEERWRFDGQAKTSAAAQLICRGVAFSQRPGAAGPCAQRIIAASPDARLFALDATNGQLCRDFGEEGFVSLLAGMGDIAAGAYFVASPPMVVGNHIVVGGWTGEAPTSTAPSGVVRAFDVRSGRLQWAWDMGRPRRSGAPARGETYTGGTPMASAPFAADPDLNLVYVPTGAPPLIVDGSAPRNFDERYANSIVALNLNSGRPQWSFQTTHRDVWDYGLVSQPALIDLPAPGGTVPVLVQGTKRGNIFVLNRRTGQPLADVSEVSVPRAAGSALALAPSQPISEFSLLPPKLTEADMWGVTPLDQLICRIKFRSARYDGPFTVPGTTPSITYPGALGMIDWGGIALDDVNKLVVATTSTMASYDRMVPSAASASGWRKQSEPFLGPLNVPCTQPPWGHLHLFDLKTNRHAWSRPIGSARDSGPFGLPSLLPFSIGTPSLGGSLVTHGALIFHGATLDRTFRAYHVFSGEELWHARLPAGGQATPMTYGTESGRQFVVIVAGGHQGLGTRTGDSVVAFALPQE